MYRKMRHENVSFRGYHGKSRFLHVVEHINEQTEVKVGSAEGKITVAGDRSDNTAADQACGYGEAPNRCLVRLPFLKKGIVLANAVNNEKTVSRNDRKSE